MPSRSTSPAPAPDHGRASTSSIGSFEAWFDQEEPEEASRERETDALNSPTPAYEPVRSTAEERRIKRTRRILLGLACLLSIGSHFGSYVIGPVKKSLHTSESGFASLISSFQLVNTITPLISGLLVPRFGAPAVGLAATGAVLLGQLIVVWAQRGGTEGGQAVHGMILGLFIFGLGLAPIAVVQESIILANNSSKSKSVGKSIALGLLLGKTAAFAAAYLSEPLAAISPRLPFLVAMALSFLSFSACVAYAWLDRTLPPLDEDVNEKEVHGKTIQLRATKSYGDPFWIYIVVCALAGTWYTTIHSSSSFIQAMYTETEARAAGPASVILFSSSILYPMVGWLVDTRPQVLQDLFLVVPIAVAATYIILLLLTSIIPYWLSCVPSSLGIGMAPLLLVLVVPRLVERHQVPTALGLHKSAEMSGAVLCQTIAGWLLSSEAEAEERYASVLKLLLVLVSAQLGVMIFWWRLIRQRAADDEHDALEYGLVPAQESEGEGGRVGEEGVGEVLHVKTTAKGSRSAAETRRGVIALRSTGAFVVLSWMAFAVNLFR